MGLNAAGHQPVIAGQVAGTVGQGGQLGQQICIGTATHGVPVTQRQIGVRCALVCGHGRPALPKQRLGCAGAALALLTGVTYVAAHAYTM